MGDPTEHPTFPGSRSSVLGLLSQSLTPGRGGQTLPSQGTGTPGATPGTNPEEGTQEQWEV